MCDLPGKHVISVDREHCSHLRVGRSSARGQPLREGNGNVGMNGDRLVGSWTRPYPTSRIDVLPSEGPRCAARGPALTLCCATRSADALARAWLIA